MPLPFNKNLDLKLLKLVKDNPILYNPKQSKYLDFDSREVVWQKIGDALNRPGELFSVLRFKLVWQIICVDGLNHSVDYYVMSQ